MRNQKKPAVSKVDDEEVLADKKATRYATLKRKLAPLLAEVDKLNEELKVFYRAHPKAELGAVGFSVLQRKQLDVKAVRADLGERLALFEKVLPVETLFIRPAKAAA